MNYSAAPLEGGPTGPRAPCEPAGPATPGSPLGPWRPTVPAHLVVLEGPLVPRP
jgi:hypothetical protein